MKLLKDISNTKSFFASLSHATLSNMLTIVTISATLWFTVVRKPVKEFFEQQQQIVSTITALEIRQIVYDNKIDSIRKNQQILVLKFDENSKMTTAKLNIVARHVREIEQGNNKIFGEFEELKQIQRFWTIPVLDSNTNDSLKIGVREWRKQ